MKALVTILAAAFAVSLQSPPASAQKARVNIPFDFVANHQGYQQVVTPSNCSPAPIFISSIALSETLSA